MMNAHSRHYTLSMQRRAVAVAAILGGIVLSSCGGAGAGTSSAAHPATMPANSAGRGTIPESAAARAAGPSSTPTAKFVPDEGPAGTLVHVTGSGFNPSLANAPGPAAIGLALIRDFPGGCEVIGGVADHPLRLRVDKSGKLTGEFVISSAPSQCFQEPGQKRRVTPGEYHVSIGCLACFVGTFRVTRDPG
jgi:hypothetical protein